MAKKKSESKKMDAPQIISAYMDYVLEEEKYPASVFKFAKIVGIDEQEFYQHFGSFDGLKQQIWHQFYENVQGLISKSKEFPKYTNREKLLTFYYTMFEVLTANRSYVLFALKDSKKSLKELSQLSLLRKDIKAFGTSLAETANEEKNMKLLKQPQILVSEATWVQFLFLLQFWIEDNSPGFEKTDVAIEKSVNTVFDLLNTTPIESLVDFGKFLWKEKIMS